MTRQITLALLAVLSGCTTQAVHAPKPAFDSSQNPQLLTPDIYANQPATPQSDVRYGRYTLVSTQPESGQQDLMSQIIDVTIPASMSPNVRDAMQYVVDRSGYSLCPASEGHVNILYTRPLPAAQYKLGPMTLRNTLQVLAGPAWQVKVDEVSRRLCFALRPGYQLPPQSQPAAVVLADAGSAPALPVAAPAAVPGTPGIETSTTSTPLTTSPVAPAKDGPSPAPSASATTAAATASSKTPAGPAAVAQATPAPAKATPVPRPLPQIWTAEAGSTLRGSVEAWAKKADWKVIWEQEDLNYPIVIPLRFEGEFQDAISQVFPLYDTAPRPFVVDGNASQRLIHVAERKRK